MRRVEVARSWVSSGQGSRQIATVFGTGGVKVVSAALSFLGFILLARAVGPVENGRVGVIFSAGTLLAILVQGGGHVTILRFAPSELRRQQQAVVGWAAKRSLRLLALLGPVAFVTSLTVLDLSFAESSAICVLAAALGANELVGSSLRSNARILFSVIPRDVVWRLLVVVVALATMRAELSAGNLMLIVGVLLVVITATQSRMLRLSGFECLDGAEQRSLSRHASAAWLSSSAFAFSRMGDVVVVGALASESAGGYFAANRVSALIAIGIVSLNTVFAPRASRLYSEGRMDVLQAELRRSVAVVGGLSCVVVAVASALSGPLLQLFASDYSQNSTVLVLLLVSALFNSLGGPGGQLMQMVGMERQHAKIMVMTQGIGLILMVLLYQWFALEGVALSVLVTTVAWNGLSRFYLVGEHQIDPTIFALFRRDEFDSELLQ